tara:strand:+ start:4742 stop:5344 length:603 start_codon:yes stop_codon:yes gene_type:complete
MKVKKNHRIISAVNLIKYNFLNYEKIIDIGARDCLVKRLLEDQSKYLSIDIYQNSLNNIDIVGDVTNLDLSFIGKNDIVLALDVLEHIDDIHTIVERLFKSNAKAILICLPNTSNWKYRFNYLIEGRFPGNKYKLISDSRIIDRHRWVTPIFESISMVKIMCKKTDRKFSFYPVDRHFLKLRFPSFLTGFRSWAAYFIIT